MYQILLGNGESHRGGNSDRQRRGERQVASHRGLSAVGKGDTDPHYAWRDMGVASHHATTLLLALLKQVEASPWPCVRLLLGREVGDRGRGLPAGFAPAVPQCLDPGSQVPEGGSGAGGESPAAQHQRVDLGTRDMAVRGAGWPPPAPGTIVSPGRALTSMGQPAGTGRRRLSFRSSNKWQMICAAFSVPIMRRNSCGHKDGVSAGTLWVGGGLVPKVTGSRLGPQPRGRWCLTSEGLLLLLL